MKIELTNQIDIVAKLDTIVFKQHAYSLNQYQSMKQSNQYLFYLIYETDEIVGFIILLDNTSKEYELIKIGIIPNCQSKGYGYLALEMLFNQLDYQKILLEVSSNNLKAINLYKKLGFKLINKRKNYYSDNSDGLDLILEK